MHKIILSLVSIICLVYGPSLRCMEHRPGSKPFSLRILPNAVFNQRSAQGTKYLITENVNSLYGNTRSPLSERRHVVSTEQENTSKRLKLSWSTQDLQKLSSDQIDALLLQAEARKQAIHKEIRLDQLLEKCNAHASAKKGCVATLQRISNLS